MLIIAGSTSHALYRSQRNDQTGAAQDAKQANDQIEVKTDRFSGAITLTLKPLVILDKSDHQLTIDITTKLGEKGQIEFESEKDDLKAEVWFRSQATSLVDFGDQELHILIDDKPLDLGRAIGGLETGIDKSKLKPGFKRSQSFVSIFSRSDLERFSRAKRIEMRLGSVELTVSQSAVATLREYANQVLTQHKIVKERKQ
jgi:hypothetical protein